MPGNVVENSVYDVIGIGFGPSNIALAIAMEEQGFAGRVVFLERGTTSQWHSGMLLSGSDIQNSPFRDLVTPVNPQSKYTFVNFLHKTGRLFDHLNLGRLHPLRLDYFDYVSWAAGQFRNVLYNTTATAIQRGVHDGKAGWHVKSTVGDFWARSLVLGIGRKTNIPEPFD